MNSTKKTNSTTKVFSLQKVQVNNKGYDSSGVYYGTSNAWKYARVKDSMSGLVLAATREQAKIKARVEINKIYRLELEDIVFYK